MTETTPHRPSRVTFVLPEDNRSGGVRVTVLMGNALIAMGHDVRIVFPAEAPFSLNGLKVRARRFIRSMTNRGNVGWLSGFRGAITSFRRLSALDFTEREVVISVGTYTIRYLNELDSDVIRLRYNHGLPAIMTGEFREAWSWKIPTITVSGTLRRQLEEFSGAPVLAVVPNGVSAHEYFNEHRERDGVGFIYNTHPNKAMDVAERVVAKLRESELGLQLRVFGYPRRPEWLDTSEYSRYPSVDEAREIYNRCKVWLVTSHTEGLPGSVLESMACGTPVVSTDNDGSKEIISPENGVLVPRGNVDEFLPAVERVVSDESTWKRFSVAASEAAARFTWDRAAQRMDSVLSDLVAAKVASGHGRGAT
ncbi:MAG: glycosyltransferase family 4 protein [bacterium]